jgi:serine protease AprX
MATAVASGAVADLLSELPNLDPDDVKAALQRGAYDIPGDRTATGAGGLDLSGAKAAVQQMSEDRQAWSGRSVAGAYDRLASAWRRGSRSDATTAWLQLPIELRTQVAAAWATSVAANTDATDEQATRARTWAQDSDLGAGWLARTWAARTWAGEDWAARTWAARTWATDDWAARTWAARTWAARTWAARTWAAEDWAARTWAARTWAADDWSARTWSARTWSARTWAFADWDTS